MIIRRGGANNKKEFHTHAKLRYSLSSNCDSSLHLSLINYQSHTHALPISNYLSADWVILNPNAEADLFAPFQQWWIKRDPSRPPSSQPTNNPQGSPHNTITAQDSSRWIEWGGNQPDTDTSSVQNSTTQKPWKENDFPNNKSLPPPPHCTLFPAVGWMNGLSVRCKHVPEIFITITSHAFCHLRCVDVCRTKFARKGTLFSSRISFSYCTVPS